MKIITEINENDTSWTSEKALVSCHYCDIGVLVNLQELLDNKDDKVIYTHKKCKGN